MPSMPTVLAEPQALANVRSALVAQGAGVANKVRLTQGLPSARFTGVLAMLPPRSQPSGHNVRAKDRQN